jgi:hypothetical protein
LTPQGERAKGCFGSSASISSLLFPVGRERHDKRRPPSQLAFGRDLPAMAFHDLFADRQPHAHPLIFTPPMKPLKRGKYFSKSFLVEADTVVIHEDPVSLDFFGAYNRACRDYTAMSEKLDPEEVKEIMSRIFGEIAQVVTKYEGFIEKFVGDAVMALFGVPKAHEDDPVRAILAAREIHDLVEAMSPGLEKKIGRPISMYTGAVNPRR